MPNRDGTHRALLIVATGQSDVQIVRDGTRYELDKGCCAALHTQIWTQDFEIVDVVLQKGVPAVSNLGPGTVRLCTPKVDAVLEWCEQQHLQVTHALVLDTRRGPSNLGEPHHAGEIVMKRLRQKFPELSGTFLTYLEAAERLEDRDSPGEAIIRKAIVERIQEGVAQAIAIAKLPDNGEIVTSVLSGLPPVSSLAEAIVQLYARGRKVRWLSVPDANAARNRDAPLVTSIQRDVAVERQPQTNPQESFIARYRALELLRQGNLVGAWGAANHLRDDESQEGWVKTLLALYRWACSLSNDPPCDLDVIIKSLTSPLLRVGLRVECSLRAGDIPAAILGTVSFVEVAQDMLLSGHGYSTHNDWWRHFAFSEARDADLIRRGLMRVEAARDGLQCVTPIAGRLPELALALRPGPTAELIAVAVGPVQSLRNEIAHGLPSELRLRHGRNIMQNRGLWSGTDTFLSQPVIKDVLSEWGVFSPEFTLENLVAEVETRLAPLGSR